MSSEEEQNSTQKKRTSRPTKYHSANVDALVEALCHGLSVSAACGIVGIERTTFYNWKKEHPEFREAIDGARPILESNMLARITQASHDDWRAAAWILERRYPEDFSLKRTHDVNLTKSDGTNEVIEFLKQSEEVD